MSHLHSHVCYCGSLVSITDVRCRPSTGRPSGEEQTTAHEVVFPRAGVFVKHVGNQQAVADSNHVLFFNANEPYRVSHPMPGGDDCTSFTFQTETLIEVLGAYEPMARDQPGKPFGLTHGLIGPKIIIQQQELRRRLGDAWIDALEIEESALNLLYAVLRDAYRLRTIPPRQHRSDTLQLRQEWVERVKLLMAKRPGANLSLTEIARAVHCSPFHLARVFQAEVGPSIHQYHLRLRLALALERLLDRPASLTELALDLGFASHSHFTATFQRFFGISPSGFRRATSRSRLREMSKILKVLPREMR
ncbi:MAG: AraC family transcriptional regulator [Verrucomicrobia bacterium]|nr:MAG: AraC family transcriptional regulator [Verrucomicrobiota bacterium]